MSEINSEAALGRIAIVLRTICQVSVFSSGLYMCGLLLLRTSLEPIAFIELPVGEDAMWLLAMANLGVLGGFLAFMESLTRYMSQYRLDMNSTEHIEHFGNSISGWIVGFLAVSAGLGGVWAHDIDIVKYVLTLLIAPFVIGIVALLVIGFIYLIKTDLSMTFTMANRSLSGTASSLLEFLRGRK